MNAALLKRRLRARGRERGAALFIVVLVTVLLSAIGIFAVRVSTLVQIASGYNRRATSAEYVGDLAANVLLAAHSDDMAAWQGMMLQAGNDCVETRDARALTATTTPIGCKGTFNDELIGLIKKSNTALTGTSPTAATYPLGEIMRPDLPVGQGVLSDLGVEMHDPHQAAVPPAGSDVGGTSGVTSQAQQMAYTVTAHLYPPSAGGICSEDSVRSSATVKLRLYVGYSLPASTQ